jgi:hypothetical protein
MEDEREGTRWFRIAEMVGKRAFGFPDEGVGFVRSESSLDREKVSFGDMTGVDGEHGTVFLS